MSFLSFFFDPDQITDDTTETRQLTSSLRKLAINDYDYDHDCEYWELKLFISLLPGVIRTWPNSLLRTARC